MGSFLEAISQVHHQQPSAFYQKIANVSQPIQKIKQYYGLFKSVCDSFLITKEKYTQIFESTKNLQEVWDRQKVNKLDALELFSGLVAFSSQSGFRQKLKFWFVMFDFNQIKNVSFVDLQYLTLCICNATFKVLGKNAKANESEIVSWLKQDYSQKQRINITKLYAFCIQSPEVKKFFELTTKEPSNSIGLKDFVDAEKNIKKLNLPLSHTIPYIKQTKKQLQDKLQWHRQFSKRISTPYNPTTFLHTSKLSWVYGMRIQGLQKPFLIIPSQIPHSSQQLLYCTSTLMVLYNLKTNKQRYYRGHTRLISSFVYNKTKKLVISSSDSLCNKSIHVWSYDTLECVKILDTYKPVRSLALLGKNEEMLIVVCGEMVGRYGVVGNEGGGSSNKSTIMIFSLEEKLNYALVYSYTYDHMIRQIINTYTNIDQQQVTINIWNSFIIICQHTPTVIFSQFEFQVYTTEENTYTWSSNLKTLAYEFYDQPQSTYKVKTQAPLKHKNKITCCVALYVNEENPCLRSFITSEEMMSLCVITGHQNGQVKCVYYSDGQFGSEDVILEESGGNTPRISRKPIAQQSSPNQSSFPQNNPQPLSQHPITCLKHTDSHIIFSHSSFITIMPFSFLVNKQQSHLRTINILDYPDLRLFNPHIHYFALSQNQLILVTQNEGDFVAIDNRKILFSDMSFVEKQMVKKIKTLTKIQSNANSTMCLLEKVQTQHLVYLTTQDRKILIMNSFSKEVENVWEINSPGDHITAIDAVYTDEDVLYFVCGCKEGKLYIRVDNQENPKFYDCVSEIIDVKISKDASYLLVATVQKYLYFFTQINKNFSSPRKMHFQNQIPICMNFLDSNKMFTVNTSAKNVYTIEIPQLKYKNVQKQSQKINISKMKIMHPSSANSYGNSLKQTSNNANKKPQKGSPYIQQSEKSLVYTKSYLGGQLKYFLMTLHNGDLLFFENRYHLSNLSYVNLKAHWGQISTITIVEGQEKFYTLGKYDNTLLEWQTQSTRTLTNVPQSVRLYSQKVSVYEQDEFDKMREMSFYYKLLNYSKPDDIYLFKGTHNEKLNEAIKKSLSDLVIDQNKIPNKEESFDSSNIITSKKNLPNLSQTKLNMRQPNLSLDMAYVFGIECYKRLSVVFLKQDNQKYSILYHSSRFLLSLEFSSSNKKKQHVLKQQKYKISCFILTEDQKILYALAEPNPKIRIHGCDQTLQTTHELGIIHFSIYRNYLLSYGILKNTYSINLHNYKTGQLLAKRTTQLKIHQFIFNNKSQIISLNEIRIWKDLYPSEKIGKATSGILMPNNSDVCIATDNGSISILNTKKGIFTVVTKAHQSDITCMKINKLQGNQFELVTVSKDDKIKIWNEKFNCKLMINLRDQLLKNMKYLIETEDQRRGFEIGLQNVPKDTFARRQSVPNYRILNIRGIDSRKGKILVYLATGQVYIGKLTLINRKNQIDRSLLQDYEQGHSQNQPSIASQSNESIFIQMQKNQNRKDGIDYQKQWQKVIESHSCETPSIFKKFICFAVHPEYPIVVSVGGNDRKLLFRNYQTCEMVDTYYCEQSRISCLKFSKKGKLLVMGFRNGTIKIYSFELNRRQSLIRGVELRFSQKFTVKDYIRCQPISIELSQKSIYFSVSFIGYRSRQQSQTLQHQQPPVHQQQHNHKTHSFIQIYKQKHQYSQQSASSEQTFYSLIDTLHVKQDQNSLITNNKYIRCVYHMAFTYSVRDDLMVPKEKDNNNNIKPLQNTNDKSMCLVMYEQFVNENYIRLNHSQRDRFVVYVIEEKVYAKKEFEEVDWGQMVFPELVNVLQLNRFKNQILFLNCENGGGDKGIDGGRWSWSGDEEYGVMEEKFDQNALSISAMCYYKRDFIIYGGTHGKLHLLRLSSLLTSKTDPLQQIKQQQMSISKTYVSQSSFINHIQLTTDLKHLFVAGQLDECIVNYRVEELSMESDLDYQLYDMFQDDVGETYVTKERFYKFVNSIMPLREEIRNLLEDVEGFDQKGTNISKDEHEVGLEVIKVVGRRAYDRCNNIYMNQQNLIYTIGPNLIIQNIIDTFTQKILPSDPNPLSYSPQISTIHMKPNSNLLILATEEQASRLFVWDIRASICLSQVQVNCSVIYSIRMVGDRYAVFYGINSMYQLVIQVVDWKLKRVVALNNFLHSATWKIKDICAIELQDKPIQQNTIKFITCGVQHLSQWHIRSNTLIQTHFIDIPSESSFQVINYFKDEYIITGCEKGSIYLWKDRVLAQQLKVQTGPIRALEVIVESSTIVLGGMDSHVYICKLEEDEIYVESSKSLNPKLQQINNTSNLQQSTKGQNNKQTPQQQQPSTFLTQFDIQSLIYSPLIDMTKKYNSLPQFEECNFFAGTRSGDIYFCEYNLKEKEFISISQVVYGQDHETIVCTAFSDKEEILYTLTTSGKLQAWDLKMFEKAFSYKFMKKAKKLYVYKGYLLICFQKEIIFIQLDMKDKMIKIDQNMTLNFDGIISECVLSFNQEYLAVGLHKNQSNEIMIYQLEQKELIYHSPSLKYEIEFLDFSTDEKYLLYKDKFEEIGMIYLVTLKRINTIFVEMKIQWQTEGLRISPKAQRIYCSYNCENRITTISKLSQNYILVGDEMGTLRIFPYPPDSHRLGQLHTSCYTHHMNKINSIKQHKELTYVATTAVYDRSLILWRKFGLN